ncbi:hypothetical protein [Olivibacter domesticus]|uniref:Right handed beta helix region n=1 Tax=Olivibacter domesticus TaxID=407022 RepID=A0A1H7Y7H9_OLID1|nr:hypothetical protein [Olivibacter domesticus]SEM42122.1 hypothetical protein SAMN05661044_05145 [Olivibacter domesticus]
MIRAICFFILSIVFLASCKKNADINELDDIPTDTLQGVISTDITLKENANYLLKGQVVVQNNAVLTIAPGVSILVEKSDSAINKGSLIITQGAKIVVNGTEQHPVVFTSAAKDKQPGDWGAIVILGKAPINTKTLNVPGLGNDKKAICGGNNAEDNSGSIQYLRIEYGGGLNPKAEDEWAIDKASGLCLAAVGSSTILDHIMVSHSRDDAFQFLGGTVNAKNLIAYNNGDDDYDFDLGYNGRLQFIVSYRTAVSDWALRANGIESLNDADASSSTPYTRPIISNATIIGTQGVVKEPTNQNQGVYIRKNTRFAIQNSIIAEYPQGGLMVCNKTRPLLMEAHASSFKYNLVHCEDNKRAFTWDKNAQVISLDKVVPDPELTSFATNQENQNVLIATIADLKFSSIYPAQGAPILSLLQDSPAFAGANFTDADYSLFFEKVSFRGAAGQNNWLAGNWVNWE